MAEKSGTLYEKICSAFQLNYKLNKMSFKDVFIVAVAPGVLKLDFV